MQSRDRRSRLVLVRMLLFTTVPGVRGLLSSARSFPTLPFPMQIVSTCLFSEAVASPCETTNTETKPKYNPTANKSSNTTSDSNSDSITRKRLGKSSFLYKQTLAKRGEKFISRATSPEELRTMAKHHSGKSIGSSQHKKAWTRWLYLVVESIRDDLGASLQCQFENDNDEEAVRQAFEKLFFDLGVAADVGEMPSFESHAARTGYALEFFCRSRALAEFLLETPSAFAAESNSNSKNEAIYPEFWTNALRGPECPMLGAYGSHSNSNSNSNEAYEIVSLGGGPGFDFVGVAMAAAFSFHTSESSTANVGPRSEIHVTAMDYEEGWSDLVSAMDKSTRKILTPPIANDDEHSPLPAMSCDWGGKCDITKSILHEPVNAKCKTLLLGDGKEHAASRLWICQYCVAENAKALRASDYIFLKELVREMQEGSMVLLTEVVPRLWPEMVRMLDREGLLPMVDVGFRKGYSGKQFLLEKRSKRRTSTGDGPFGSLDSRTRDQLEHFERLASYHERKVDSGWKRQGRKTNGSAYHEEQERRGRKTEQE